MGNQNSKLGFIGIGIGAIALLLALVHFWAGPFSRQPSVEQTVADTAVSIRNATVAALRGEQPEPSARRGSMDIDKMTSLLTAVLGGLAIILGVVGYAKREPLRVASGAAVLGGSAIAFQFAAVALGVIVLAILVAAVVSQLGIG